MRKFLFLIFLLVLLSGCTRTDTIAAEPIYPTETASTSAVITPAPMELIIYSGNDNADGFNTNIKDAYYFNSYTIIEELISVGVLNDNIVLQAEAYIGTCLHLDFNDTFLNQLNSTGTSGEYIMIGSIVNTFLDNYKDVIDSVFITCNGEIIESGHVIYDFELTRYE